MFPTSPSSISGSKTFWSASAVLAMTRWNHLAATMKTLEPSSTGTFSIAWIRVTCSSKLGVIEGLASCWWASYDGGACCDSFDVTGSAADSMPSIVAAERFAGEAGRCVGFGASVSPWALEWDMSSAKFSWA